VINIRGKLAAGFAASVLHWFVVALAVTGTVCIAFAGYLTLRESLSPAAAAAITGAVLLAVAGCMIAIVLWCTHRRPRKKEPAPSQDDVERLLGKLLEGPLADYVRDNQRQALLAALAAGALTGASAGARQRMTRLLQELIAGE